MSDFAQPRGAEGHRQVPFAALFPPLFFAVLLAGVISPPAFAAPAAVDRSERAIGRILKNYPLIDERGFPIPLYGFRGKSVLLTFFFADCPEACPLIAHSVQDILTKLPPALRDKTATLFVTLTPEIDTAKRRSEYAADFAVPGAQWRFVALSPSVLAQLADDVGFDYQKGSSAPEHMNRLTLIGPTGKVERHFYGTTFDAAAVTGAVAAVAEGRTLGGTISIMFDKLMLYCSTYDPAKDAYRPNVLFLIVTAIQSALALATAAYFIFYLTRQSRH
ncbi:MAG: SCO family protein [Nitrospinae bacterium]|nr:SCO family protein [Nitrospinota bacterium]